MGILKRQGFLMHDGCFANASEFPGRDVAVVEIVA
jgi:hypothetical protein